MSPVNMIAGSSQPQFADTSLEELLLFMHAPPEHVAHVINAAALYSGLSAMAQGKPSWSTMNLRDPAPILKAEDHLTRCGLTEFAEACRVPIHNCASLVTDEFSPDARALESFIFCRHPSLVYTHYYAPFWNPLLEICSSKGVPFGLHVQVFYHKPGLPFHFDYWRNARSAVCKADFITVSQEADRQCLSSELAIPLSRIFVLPKSVPPRAKELALAESSQIPFRNEHPSLYDALSRSVPKILYVGRLEPIKNIDWFLQNCMPHLHDRLSEFQLIIVGRGRSEMRVAELASKF